MEKIESLYKSFQKNLYKGKNTDDSNLDLIYGEEDGEYGVYGNI